jgi:hypothetical protein
MNLSLSLPLALCFFLVSRQDEIANKAVSTQPYTQITGRSLQLEVSLSAANDGNEMSLQKNIIR